MINLRYHIVSITAVFLALGIGLAFGAAFIDRATVEALNRNLTDIENQNTELEDENARLRDEVDTAEQTEQDLIDQGLDQFVAGELEGQQVLVLAADGVDEGTIDRLGTSLDAAGARRAGTLRATDRIALDDDSEVEDLQEVLGLPDAPPGQLRTATVRQLRTTFAAAMAPAEEASGEDPGEEGSGDPTPVPGIIAALLEGGFLELDVADTTVALVPDAGLRLVLVVGHDAPEATEGLLVPLARALALPQPTDPDAAPLPLLVAEPSVEPAGDDEPELVPYVSGLRDDDVVGPRIATVDGLEGFAGLAGTVLAVGDAGAGRLGHYGTLDDAQALLPAPGP
jgi:hypothetical protein